MKQSWMALLLVFCLTSELYLNAQPLVQVWSKERSEILQKYTQIYLNQLDLTGGFGLIVEESSRMPASLDGLTISDPITHTEDIEYYRILIRANLKKHELLLTLAHEMIHLKQMVAEKLMIINNRKVCWDGKIYFIGGKYSRSLPWEKTAFEEDNYLFGVALEVLEENHKRLAALEK